MTTAISSSDPNTERAGDRTGRAIQLSLLRWKGLRANLLFLRVMTILLKMVILSRVPTARWFASHRGHRRRRPAEGCSPGDVFSAQVGHAAAGIWRPSA